jgi:SSS family solute:Na+ symporter
MVSGILGAMILPALARSLVGPGINPLYLFPFIFGLSVIGCLMGSLLTKPESLAVLDRFYRTVNPWGAWGPVRARVMREDPRSQPNDNFGKDSVNVLVGIIWQLCLTALPIYLVLRRWTWVGSIGAVLTATTIFLKFNWYDKLEPAPVPAPTLQPPPSPNL